MFGPLTPDVRQRVAAYLAAPSERGWEDINSVIIKPEGHPRTLWQAVRAVDPSFPSTGPKYSLGRRVEGWKRIPNAILLARAIKQALS